jgi:hypothetical protein
MWSSLGSYQMLRKSSVWLKCYWGGQIYGQTEVMRTCIYFSGLLLVYTFL